ncbi:MAG: hypothetical protein M3164_08130 [Actinomycetota bacterium]|nr:hypothetical protein [Actinomycetota bacterium]
MSATATDEPSSHHRGTSGAPPSAGLAAEATGGDHDQEKEESARHTLRRRTVEWFIENRDDPRGAMPQAVMHVVGGPMMWSDEPVRASQFTDEQKDLLLRACREIKELHAAAGGKRQKRVRYEEGLGLMPERSSDWPYQSEEWAAERALNTGPPSEPIPPGLTHSQRLDAELSEAYYVVTTWMDYVRGGLTDASAVYEHEDDEPDA